MTQVSQILPTFTPVAPGTKAVIVDKYVQDSSITIYGVAVEKDTMLCATTQGVLKVDSVLNSTGSTEEGCAFGILNPDGTIDGTGHPLKDVFALLHWLDKLKAHRAQRLAAHRAQQSATGGGAKRCS